MSESKNTDDTVRIKARFFRGWVLALVPTEKSYVELLGLYEKETYRRTALNWLSLSAVVCTVLTILYIRVLKIPVFDSLY
jgi:hypothetical protein